MCDFRLSYGRVLNRRSKIIAVNRDKSQLLKNSDMFWKPTVAIQGEQYILLYTTFQSLGSVRYFNVFESLLRLHLFYHKIW